MSKSNAAVMAALHGRWSVLPLALAVFIALVCALPVRACTEATMLDFIGSLEAPGGYDTVYYGVRVSPPRSITTMRVDEVLDWQRQAVRGASVSSAAGRYQIIRPTLQRLVHAGLVAPGAIFDAATQDRLAQHLLRETGYRAGDTTPATANRIAGVWAALPRIGGAGDGRSVYEGLAGNHALVGATTYAGVLACRISVAETIAESAAIRAGLRFGFAWDHFLEQMAVAVKATVRSLVRASTTLLLILFTVDLVWRGGKWATGGAGAAAFMEGLVFRLLAVLFCMAILSAGDAVIGFIADSAGRLARAAGAREVFALQEFAASKLALAFSLFEGAGNTPIIIQVQITLMAVLVVVLAALQMAVVIFWYARLFLAAAAGILVVGFGGLSQGMAAARAWLVSLIGAGLSLMVLMLVLNITPTLAWDLRSAADPITTAPLLLLLELLALILMFMLPRTAASLVKAMR